MQCSESGTPTKRQPQFIWLMGKTLKVCRDGYWWKPPYQDSEVRIGETRIEAMSFLKDINGATTLVTALKAEAKPKPIKPLKTRKPRKIKATMKELLLPYYWARSRARQLGREVMSRDEYLAMCDRSCGYCEVSGLPFSQAKLSGTSRRPWSYSIDRINPLGGYEAENCRLVCSAVNLAMNEYGADSLLTIARAMVAKHGAE